MRLTVTSRDILRSRLHEVRQLVTHHRETQAFHEQQALEHANLAGQAEMTVAELSADLAADQGAAGQAAGG